MTVIDKLASLSGWRFALMCVLIGLTGVLGFAPFHIWPVTIGMFAFAFRFIVLAKTPKRAFWTAMLIGLGYFMGQTYWVGEAFIIRGPEFIPAMPPMVLGLALILAVFWAAAGWVFKRFRLGAQYPYLTLAGLFFIAEFGRGHVLGGFPWNLPGYVFKGGSAMSQSASVFGIYGAFITGAHLRGFDQPIAICKISKINGSDDNIASRQFRIRFCSSIRGGA